MVTEYGRNSLYGIIENIKKEDWRALGMTCAQENTMIEGSEHCRRNLKGKKGTFHRVKFEVFGEEMIEKLVKPSGNSGRIYLPSNWVNHHVKIIKIE